MFVHKPVIVTGATQINESGFRKYKTPDGKFYPSITTVIGRTSDKSGLTSWQNEVGKEVANYIMTEAARIGTHVHQMIEDYLNNREFTIEPYLIEEAHFLKMKPYLDLITNIRATEVSLYSDTLQVAGTCDLVAEYDGKLSIIDYKTKRSKPRKSYDVVKGYFEQATAYGLMWEERTGEKVEQIVIIASDERNNTTVFVQNPDDYRDKLRYRLERFKAL